jgi:hypothetical protein
MKTRNAQRQKTDLVFDAGATGADRRFLRAARTGDLKGAIAAITDGANFSTAYAYASGDGSARLSAIDIANQNRHTELAVYLERLKAHIEKLMRAEI